MTRGLLACVLLSITACGADTPTQLLVRVDAESLTVSRAQRLRVRIWGGTGGFAPEPTSERTIDLRPDGGMSTFPGTIPIVPPPGSSLPRQVLVEIALIDGAGGEISWARVSGSYVANEVREAFVCFDDRCLTSVCGAVETCIAGESCETCRQGACAPASVSFVRLGEAPGQCPARECGATAVPETDCQNRIDDDRDCLTDCLDPDCNGLSCGEGVCGGEANVDACHDGVDDDCDGLVDCADDDCRGSLTPESGVRDPTLCTNTIDDDCNGLTDCDDPGCRVFIPETGMYCSNRMDDDGDGAIDSEDVDCLGAPSYQPGYIWCETARGAGLPLVEKDAQNDPDNCGACYLTCRARTSIDGTTQQAECDRALCSCVRDAVAPAEENFGCPSINFACNVGLNCRCANESACCRSPAACQSPNTACLEPGGTGGHCGYVAPTTSVLCR